MPRAVTVALAAALALQLRGGCAQQFVISTFAGGLSGMLAPLTVPVNAPYGVAVDGGGNVYFADSSGHCVWLLNGATGSISMVAGNGVQGFSGDGGPATSALVNGPAAVALDGGGNLFISDGNRIRRVAAGTGIITTVAGNGGGGGFSGDGVPATNTSLNTPLGLAVDGSGNLLIADANNNRIRRVAADTGIITTVAGNGTTGYRGDGGAATSTTLSFPSSVAVDGGGNLFITDTNNFRIRRVAAGTGVVTTVAGNGVNGVSNDGGAATSSTLIGPRGVLVDGGGNLLIAEGNRIRRVAAGTGVISTVAGSAIAGFSGDGGAATSARLNNPPGLAMDGGGNLFIADGSNNRLRRVAAGTGIITTVAGSGETTFSGDGVPATSAMLRFPYGLAMDGGGNLFIADANNHRVRRVAAGTRVITTVAGNGTFAYRGDGLPATSASLFFPQGVAVDGGGNLFIADTYNHRIRRVAADTGVITTVAGTGTAGFSGDGEAATSARLWNPAVAAVDGSGNLFIADTTNHRIRRVAADTGVITTVAGNGTAGFRGDGVPATSTSLNSPQGVALDGSGNLFIADTLSSRIRRVAADTGVITTVAGNGTAGFRGDGVPATSTSLNAPMAPAVDGSGNLFIADSSNQRIRRVAAGTGVITTVAGTGTAGFSSDVQPATSAALRTPRGLAVDGSGNLFIADSTSSRIRQLVASTPEPSSSAPVAATPSQTGTASSSSTGTGSSSATGTATRSQTGTASSSSTGTGSSSATGTATRSQTGTASSSSTGTGSSSATGTGSSSATGTPTSSDSSAATPSSSRAARSPSRAARSPSRAATRSRTRSRSRARGGDTTPSNTVTTTPRPSRSNGHKGGCGYGGPCYTNSPTKSFNQYAVSRSPTRKAKRA